MTDEELKGVLGAHNAEMRQHFDATVERIEARSDAATARIEASAIETRRHCDVTAERLERKIQLVVETVALMDQKFDRRIDDLEARMERGFTETQAMIKTRA